MRSASLVALLVLVLAVASGCRSSSDIAPEPSARPAESSQPSAAGHVRLTDAPPDGDVEQAVRRAASRALQDKRQLVVYVGASWCEPCQRFHHAAEGGELDAAFPDVDFLVFDLDRDRERLRSAGYVSKLIPLFALPESDGRSSAKQIEGGIKGDRAVDNLAPRLKGLLGRS